ncbi:MAG TPA: cytochrome c [Mucilaginibacter sp.]|jgi:mono/diheme cytochrome c family protein
MKTKQYFAMKKFNLKGLPIMAAFLVFNLVSSRSFAQHKPWVTPKPAETVKNPLAGNSSVLADAKTLYMTNCAPCHGNKGKGDGPAAQALVPKPADHTSTAVQAETDGSLFWKLSEGRNPMPSYKKILSDQQRWELVNYIRTLRKNTGVLAKSK